MPWLAGLTIGVVRRGPAFAVLHQLPAPPAEPPVLAAAVSVPVEQSGIGANVHFVARRTNNFASILVALEFLVLVPRLQTATHNGTATEEH